jgi:hypothetical protein
MFRLVSATAAFVLAASVSYAADDHLECYKIKDPLALRGIVDLDSPQFGVAAGCSVSKAKMFCVPAEKTVIQATDKNGAITLLDVPGPDPGDRICYKIKCPAVTIPDQQVSDQFGTRTITKFKTAMMCTPAVKGLPPSTTTTTTTTTLPLLPDGSACTLAAQCVSASCVDGVCCNTACAGTCQACTAAKKGSGIDGSCGSIASGLDPDNECAGTLNCNGSGFCQTLPDGAACTTNGECTSGGCVDGVCCNAECAGTCQACTAAKKGSGIDGSCGSIATGLDPDNECAGTLSCNGSGFCQTLPLGAACTTNGECASGSCVDGVCCNTACAATCQACTAAKKGGGIDGSCGFIASGTDPDDECAGAQTCDGGGVCL